MANPRPDENQISMTTFLIGVVAVVGLFIAVQIGRAVLAPPEPKPTEVDEPTPDQPDEDEVEDEIEDEPSSEPKERPHEYDPPLDGEVKYDADRKRLVVTRGEDRDIVSMDDLVGVERERNGAVHLRANDGRRVAVTEQFINDLPTRVRYQFDYESSGNVDTGQEE